MSFIFTWYFCFFAAQININYKTMKKQVILELVVEFPHVQFRIPGGATIKAYRAVVDTGDGCKCCALKQVNICPYVNCENVFYVSVLDKPCL